MNALLADPIPATEASRYQRVLVLRPAPRREPPFDDETSELDAAVTRHDCPLPLVLTAVSPAPVLAHLVDLDGLPDPVLWARSVLIGLVEFADGRRPARQVARLLSASVAHGLLAEIERAAHTHRGHWLRAATIRTVRAMRPAEGVAEVCATAHVHGRVRAVALRAESRHGQWQVTRLQLG